MRNSFLILEANEIARTGIHSLIAQCFPGVEIKDAETESEAVTLLTENHFDVIILSSFWGNSHSVAYCRQLQQINPQVNIIMFATNKNNLHYKSYIKAGVRGCINIDEEPNEKVCNSIKHILAGNIYISEVFNRYAAANTEVRKLYGNPFHTLSQREKQVVEQLFQGKKMKQIADFLEVRNTTVSTYKTRLFNKLNIPDQSLIKLVSLARIHNIIM